MTNIVCSIYNKHTLSQLPLTRAFWEVAARENALVIVDQPVPLAELAATLELAADFARASKAKTTLAAYGSDWRVFECWCQERGLAALAASPEVVCGFLADEATRGRRASTLEGALAAILDLSRAYCCRNP